ncbi:unnamed protein product [Onchocerca flexuosa]|uniref:C-type lectin domain-containing protein n=1 Tax=Onchocerca flexuosa TaxID=387005 RepID=A0A183HBT2_9BILA|nr:unnamed protein product [Onchocerca flexuosa]
MGRPESQKDSLLCECYYISGGNAFWNQKNCNSTQQWICQFAPEAITSERIEIYDKSMMQHTISSGLSNDESDDETSLRTKDSFCEEYEWNGVTIPRTLACSEAKIPCPDPENIIGKQLPHYEFTNIILLIFLQCFTRNKFVP